MSASMFEIKNLYVSRGEAPLVCGSDFSVSEGEIVGLFGESGTGKSVFSIS